MLGLIAVCAAVPAWALYKVVGPDGKVTYTDRPPVTDTAGKVNAFKPGHAAVPDTGLPAELRQAVSRYPVTLYGAADCVPCDSARQLLTQRGVPHAEKRVITEEDVRAYEQLTGGRTMPALSIGGQILRGLNTTEWMSYLDAAGYPKESRLPKDWKPPAATPLVEVKAAAAEAQGATPQEPPAPPVARKPPPPPPPPSTSVRF
jgi:glutaredoxin